MAPAEVGSQVVPNNDAKRPAINQQRKEKAKKQANAVCKDIQPIVTQGLGRNVQAQEKLTVLVTLPGNITDKSQLHIEFDEASNGGILVLYAPRGIMSTNMDKVQIVMASMPGLDKHAAQEPQH